MDHFVTGLPLPESTNEPGVVAATVYAGGRRIADIAIERPASGRSSPATSSGSACTNRARRCCSASRTSSISITLAIEDAAQGPPASQDRAIRRRAVHRRAHGADGRRPHRLRRNAHVRRPRLRRLGPPRRIGVLPPVRQRCEACPTVLSHGEDYILYAILDFIVDNYMPVARDRSRPRSMRSRTASSPDAHASRCRAALHAAPRSAAPAQRRAAAGRGVPPARACRGDADRRGDAAAVPRRDRPHPPRAGGDRFAARGAGVRLRGKPDDRAGAADRRSRAGWPPGPPSSPCRPRSPASTA